MRFGRGWLATWLDCLGAWCLSSVSVFQGAGFLNVAGGLEAATDRTTYFKLGRRPVSDVDMGQEVVVSVWGARGGHGATTVATVAAALSGARLIGGEPWAPEWILGHPLALNGAPLVIRDAGQLNQGVERSEVNIVVLRGPCLMALRSVSSLIHPGDQLVLVREPWRVISKAEVLSILDRKIAIEIPFTERVARLIDSGLLGTRLEDLSEFADLADWLEIVELRKRRSA